VNTEEGYTFIVFFLSKVVVTFNIFSDTCDFILGFDMASI